MTLRTIVLLAGAIAHLAAADRGIRPLPSVEDYPFHIDGSEFALGAKILTEKEVEGAFVSGLNRAGYAVLEVAIYPKDGKAIAIDRGDFLLIDTLSGRRIRPAEAKALAALLQKANRSDREITVYPTVGVGYETGDRYDPVAGRRGGGWNTSVGVGVGVGGSSEAATPADRKTMELELTEKGVPEGKTAKPAAGYLYFPLERKKDKKVALRLEFMQPEPDGVRLELEK